MKHLLQALKSNIQWLAHNNPLHALLNRLTKPRLLYKHATDGTLWEVHTLISTVVILIRVEQTWFGLWRKTHDFAPMELMAHREFAKVHRHD